MDLRKRLRGITCPLVTPFESESDTVDKDALENLVDHLLEGGIDGLFPCGTAGEFASLTPEERRFVNEIVVKRTDGEVPVLAGAAATTVDEAVAYANHAEEIGADAAVVPMPYFHTANDPVGNQRFFEEIADRSSLPILLYNIPFYTGGRIDLDTLTSVASHENIFGVKDSSGDLEYFLSILRQTPDDFVVLQGYDTLLAPALRMGADGGLNAGSNVAPGTYAELYDMFDTKRGKNVHDALVPFFDACTEYGFAPGTKTALEYRGVIPTDTVRPPIVSPSNEGRKIIEESVDTMLER